MYKNSDFKIIRDIVLKKLPNVVAVYLFGSYAKNTASKDSDIDIAILLERKLEWKERKSLLNYLYRETGNKGMIVDFVLKTNDDFQAERSYPTMARVIHREGRLLWTKG